VSESEQVAQESELIPETQSSSSTLRGLMYEMTQLDSYRSEETPRSMSWMESEIKVSVANSGFHFKGSMRILV
jgi:hypothetical protein